MVKELVPVTALNNDSLFSTVDDKSGAGGLLSREIPDIVKRAYCEPIARCPADFCAASLS